MRSLIVEEATERVFMNERFCHQYVCVSRIALVFSTFVLCVIVPIIWFRPGEQTGIWLRVHTNVVNYKFSPSAVEPNVVRVLRTTNILQGTFVPLLKPASSGEQESDSSQRISLFLASWSGAANQPMTMFDHTPDICWPNAGWSSTDLGQPFETWVSLPIRQTVTTISGLDSDLEVIQIPCAIRIFAMASTQEKEMVLWCPIVGGRVVRTSSIDALSISWSRAGEFMQSTATRVRARGAKQYLRLSIPVNTDWRSALQLLREFAATHLYDGSGQTPRR
jgi:hypothetical protein